LSSKSIDYINFQKLGAPKDIRDELYKSGNYNRFFRKYQRNISDQTDLLKAIHGLVNTGKKVTLLCFERDPQKCHRKVVAEEIKKLDSNGLKVKHLMPV
ncbi:unnamed protein product, partial [marine sediment metagenome]